MENIEKLESKINKLEYDRIAKLEEKVSDIQVNLERNNVLTENSIKSQEAMSIAVTKMADAMDSVKITMCQLSGQMDTSNSKIESLGKQVTGLKEDFTEQVEKVQEKVEAIDGKGKIDTAIVWKDIVLKFVIGGGALGAIFAVIQSILK